MNLTIKCINSGSIVFSTEDSKICDIYRDKYQTSLTSDFPRLHSKPMETKTTKCNIRIN